MSEYQYYEFQAVDRPLTHEQMAKLRSYSSRAQITSGSFTVVYNYGSFKGDENQWMEKYFDAFLYMANWGSRQFMLRLPRQLFKEQAISPYCTGESLTCRWIEGSLILSFQSEDEDSGWAEGEGWLGSLMETRSALMHGDYRALYLGWLLAVQTEQLDEDDLEPPVPSGLGSLSASLDRLADFLQIDDDLIAAAAECSSGHQDTEPALKEINRWLLNLSSKEKDSILLRLIEGNDPHLAIELRRRAATELRGTEKSAEAPRRTAGDIAARARVLAEARRKKEAGQRAREKARREQEQAEKRRKHLDSLSGKESKLWGQVDELIATKLPKRYDEAVALLQDLRDLAAGKGEGADFSRRMRALQNEHARKPSLMEKFRAAKLLG